MNEQNKKQMIVAGVLMVALLGVLVYQFGIKGLATEVPASGSKPATREKAPRKSRVSQTGSAAVGSGDLDSIDIMALIDTVEVIPFDYALSRTARTPMAPLVGTLPPGLSTDTGASAEADALAYVQRGTTATREVSGIIWDKNFPVAIVDDVVVLVGYEFHNGALVHSIEPLRVLFKVGETIIPVGMKEF